MYKDESQYVFHTFEGSSRRRIVRDNSIRLTVGGKGGKQKSFMVTLNGEMCDTIRQKELGLVCLREDTLTGELSILFQNESGVNIRLAKRGKSVYIYSQPLVMFLMNRFGLKTDEQGRLDAQLTVGKDLSHSDLSAIYRISNTKTNE